MLTTNQILQQGRYRVIQPLSGAGFEAFDDVYKTNVVLKQFSFGTKNVMTAAQIEAVKNSFADEAKTLMRIQHPAILKIHGWFSELDANYLVSEFADGNFLSEMLKRVKKPFPLADVSSWAEKLLDALSYLHNFLPPIVHRSIKPENLKLTSAGEIKLLVSSLSEEINSGRLNYLPLEQIWKSLDAASRNLILNSYDDNAQKILQKPADASSDIYALGATLYHLLTAELPIDALERSIEVLEGNADPLKPPHEINPSIPQEISGVVMKALEIKRENRFHSAAIMRQVWRTACVRVQERSAPKSVQIEEDMLEIPVPAQKSLDEERQLIEQERMKIEAEQKRLEEERLRLETEEKKRQQKLLEESERLKREREELENQRRIEAEQKHQAEILEQQRLAEILEQKQKAELLEQQRQAEILEQQQREAEELKAAQFAEAEKIEEEFPEIIEESVAEKEHFPEIVSETKPLVEESGFMDSYAEPPKKSSKTMAMAAGAFVILICAAAAFWFFTQSKPAESNQTVSIGEQNTPASNVQAVTVEPKAETTPAPSLSPEPNPSPASEVTKVSTTSPTTKVKPTLTPTPKIEVKKPNIATAKTPAPQKKTLTVDDLINGN